MIVPATESLTVVTALLVGASASLGPSADVLSGVGAGGEETSSSAAGPSAAGEDALGEEAEVDFGAAAGALVGVAGALVGAVVGDGDCLGEAEGVSSERWPRLKPIGPM
ncbi:hypothetical protein Bca52824_006327 [Brassica carinata]|uniref:Secreted protein n=1 Tax=Brassica carinata TaxID=52824 RepID=A0A8X7WSV4_BRACI|nr:hypothetical protein Bca52824_006327 [Brassica carinata]